MIKTGKELAAAAEAAAKRQKTLYVMGCFGAPTHKREQDALHYQLRAKRII